MSPASSNSDSNLLLALPHNLDPDELLEVICSYYGEEIAWSTPSNKGRFILSVPGQPPVLTITGVMRLGKITLEAIQQGPRFDQGQWEACLLEIKQSIIESTPEVWHAVCFQQYPVEGHWHSRDGSWGILPPPRTFPRPPSSPNSNNPFILEFTINTTNNYRITNQRVIRTLLLHLKVLNILVRGSVYIYPPASPTWFIPKVVPMPTEPTPQWGWHEYSRPMVRKASEFGIPEASPAIDLIDPKHYYNSSWYPINFLLPTNINEILTRYEQLEVEAKHRFELAAHWVYIADRNWYSYPSISVQALVTGIEAIVAPEDRNVPKCEKCGQRKFSSAARFKQFLTKYSHLESKQASLIYKLRSELTHGTLILGREQPEASLWRPSHEQQLIQSLTDGFRLGLREWLLAGGPAIELSEG